jgi:hypothetical protein
MPTRLGCCLLLTLLCAPLSSQTIPLPYRSRSAHVQPVTFSNQIVRIMQENCQGCHHPGEVAPFSLMTYPDAAIRAALIKNAVSTRYMPPWKPLPGRHEFVDERRLTGEEIDLIVRWADAGAPQGDPGRMPPPLEFRDNWRLGEPDLVLAIGEDYTPGQFGDDDYRCFSIPTELLQDKKIGAIEVRPGNRRIVHHVLLFPDPMGESASLHQANDPKPGYECFGDPGFSATGFLGGWAPGNSPQVLPRGVAYSIPASSRVVMQVHYHPDGTLQSDRTKVGIHFSGDPSPKELLTLPLVNMNFMIPPGAKNHEVVATVPVIAQARIYSVLPHMHLLGRQIRLEMISPAGVAETLIEIDDWDFEWQDTYHFTEPVRPPFLGQLKLTATYDNSGDNPLNPNRPPKAVGWGPKTTDEMCLAFIGFVLE